MEYTVDELLNSAAWHEREGNMTYARVLFEDAMLLDATYRIAAQKWVADENYQGGRVKEFARLNLERRRNPYAITKEHEDAERSIRAAIVEAEEKRNG